MNALNEEPKNNLEDEHKCLTHFTLINLKVAEISLNSTNMNVMVTLLWCTLDWKSSQHAPV